MTLAELERICDQRQYRWYVEGTCIKQVRPDGGPGSMMSVADFVDPLVAERIVALHNAALEEG